MSYSVENNIDFHLQKAKGFILSFDTVTNHIYGLTREAFVDVKNKVQEYYECLHQLWIDNMSKNEIIRMAKSAGCQTITDEIVEILASTGDGQIAKKFFLTLHKMNELIYEFRVLLREVIVGGQTQTSLQIAYKVDELLAQYG